MSPDCRASVTDFDNAAWLRLVSVPGLGPAAFLRLLRVWQSPAAILQAPAAALAPLLKTEVLQSLLRCRDEPVPAAWLEWLDAPGRRLLTLADSDYPESLLHIASPPPCLFAQGRLELLQGPRLAVVGSRAATLAGRRHAQQFARQLSAQGLCIVSGLAAGIDAAAHEGALSERGSTIAVVGTGLDRVYPARNQPLARRIAAEGLLLSEFVPGTPPLAGNFPRRNRIISGLSLGCLVVEASLQSGSLITAHLAAEQGRDVFAMPGPIDAPQARGCHRLLKEGAELVETADDIMQSLRLPMLAAPASPVAPDQSGPAVPAWLQALGHAPFDVDEASILSGLTAGEVCAILMQMEMAGLVASAGGGRFQRMA